jgi:glycine cleavage system T protein
VTSAYADRFFGVEIGQVDPLTDTLIRLEEERQRRRIILIPSESYVPQSVRQGLGSVFTNIYAEGYPPLQMTVDDEALLAELDQQLAYYRRYADRRFYKGADYVHFIEALAQRRAANCFANARVRAEQIHVNVQPLSGAAANLAVYDALMSPGDTLMGMDLFQGGHLTHGSEFNVSGKRYTIVSYGVAADGRLDYDQIRALAETYRPRVIVAGYTSYPWAPDWSAFRDIADAAGAYLMADIAHPAGMAIVGLYPNPVGIADVVVLTTHKTLCGPRGACILTTHPNLARKIDQAVFPGLQGGPHTNKFAAMCVAFEIARSDAFRELQQGIVDNAQALAKSLTDRGLGLAYGGTDTHLLLLDLKSVEQPSDRILYGEVMARILDLAGIVVNKNTIPGDTVTALATGLRMGTPWVTERGMGPQEMEQLAECIARLVRGVAPFTYEGMSHRLPRGKIDLHLLENVKQQVEELACSAKVEIERGGTAYPHFCVQPGEATGLAPRLAPEAPWEGDALDRGTVLVDLTDRGAIRISGSRAQPFLHDLCTANVAGLQVGEGMRGIFLDRHGDVIDDVAIWREERDPRGRDHYLVFTNPENTSEVVSWLRAVSDGYVLHDDEDVWRKVRGPATVELLNAVETKDPLVALGVRGPAAPRLLRELLGASLLALPEEGRWVQATYAGQGVYLAVDGFAEEQSGYTLWGSLAAVQAAWEALAAAGARAVRAPDAREELRRRAGLPGRWPVGREERDAARYLEAFPGLFDRRKPYFVGQATLAPPDAPEKPHFAWGAGLEPGVPEGGDAPLKRTPLHDEHQRMGAKLVPFAGWEMPVWYTRVSEEHQAVREAVGLFDVAHMGTLAVCGPYAADLMDAVTVNYVRWLADGESQYSALLDPAGGILDDMIVYRRAWDRYFVVVNAANFEKDWAWLNAVNERRVQIDLERPWVECTQSATLRNLKDPSSGADQRVDIALQGPNALRVLLACDMDAGLCAALRRLPRTAFVEGEIEGEDGHPIESLISRTGYTGERLGYELYVHPDRAVALWRTLLRAGAPHGIVPCGLAARDSLRIEAGLPLYGHELDGPLQISQSEAGFGAYVKYHKPFFVGRRPYKAANDHSQAPDRALCGGGARGPTAARRRARRAGGQPTWQCDRHRHQLCAGRRAADRHGARGWAICRSGDRPVHLPRGPTRGNQDPRSVRGRRPGGPSRAGDGDPALSVGVGRANNEGLRSRGGGAAIGWRRERRISAKALTTNG